MRHILTMTLALTGMAAMAMQSGYLPPPGVLKEVFENSTKYLYGRWNGILYRVVVEPKTIDLDDVTLLSLVYEPHEVPGMPASPPTLDEPADPERHHTRITITNRYGRIQRVYCTAASLETVTDPQGRPYRRFQECVLIEIHAYNTPADAQAYASAWSGGTYQRLGSLLSRSRLGEVHWTRPLSRGRYDIAFVVGRVAVKLEWHRRYEAARPEKAEAMAWGVLYRLLHQPRLLSGRLPAVRSDGTADRNGIKVAPLKNLEASGVRIENHQTESDWKVRVQWGQRWVELEAFGWQMKTWDGRQVKLSRPVFPYRGDLIAPLQEVKQALGMQ